MQNPSPATLLAVVTIRDVCAAFSITRPTLRSWIRNGRFPAPTRPSGAPTGKAFWTATQIAESFASRAA